MSNVTPVDGKVAYDEGVHIGYRAWLRAGTEPAYPFGHGLGYTTWTIDGVAATPAVREGDAVIVTATVANTGARAGKHVVQVYASRDVSVVDRPVRWLVGFAPVRLDAGASAEVSIEVPARAALRALGRCLDVRARDLHPARRGVADGRGRHHDPRTGAVSIRFPRGRAVHSVT